MDRPEDRTGMGTSGTAGAATVGTVRAEPLAPPPPSALPPPPAPPGPVADLIGGDWPTQAADTIDRVVGSVRRKTTGPAIVASRALVYGLVAATFGVAAVVLLVILVVRLLDLLVPTWAAHLILGAIFSAVGAWFWSKRPRS